MSPLLLFAGWAGPRGAAGLAAPFIWVNSLARLIGVQWVANSLPPELPWLAAAVLAGGWLGTALGLQRLPARTLLWALSTVLLIAGGKLLLPAHLTWKLPGSQPTAAYATVLPHRRWHSS